jgi:hypothetical protein
MNELPATGYFLRRITTENRNVLGRILHRNLDCNIIVGSGNIYHTGQFDAARHSTVGFVKRLECRFRQNCEIIHNSRL